MKIKIFTLHMKCIAIFFDAKLKLICSRFFVKLIIINNVSLALSPLQSPHAVTHFNPCLRQEQVLLQHRFLVDSLHSQQTYFSKLSGTGSTSVMTGCSIEPSSFHPQCWVKGIDSKLLPNNNLHMDT